MIAGCQSSAVEFNKVDDIPEEVQEKADPQKQLQSVEIEDEKGVYMILHANGEVKTDVDTEGDTVFIDFNVSDSPGDGVAQNTYYLTTDQEHDTIRVSLNGEETSVDESILL